LQYRIGCSGWSYTPWKGPFYPFNLDNSHWLRLIGTTTSGEGAVVDYAEKNDIDLVVLVTKGVFWHDETITWQC
jgi:hypothetical protein